ncbi:MAG: 50S ribosomal protein L32 [Myxococcales bacterium]|nr:50S ribosomal protein L32 [Myxococcales bacterium]
MPVPKKRSSRSVIGMRRSHDHLHDTLATEACPKCNVTKLRHHVCPSCGEYRGVRVFVDNLEASTPVVE